MLQLLARIFVIASQARKIEISKVWPELGDKKRMGGGIPDEKYQIPNPKFQTN